MSRHREVLSDEEIGARLVTREHWRREGDTLTRELRFHDFSESVAFVNRVLPHAEEIGHHPDLSISWNTVDVSLTTHSCGAITERDFELARRIDAVA